MLDCYQVVAEHENTGLRTREPDKRCPRRPGAPGVEEGLRGRARVSTGLEEATVTGRGGRTRRPGAGERCRRNRPVCGKEKEEALGATTTFRPRRPPPSTGSPGSDARPKSPGRTPSGRVRPQRSLLNRRCCRVGSGRYTPTPPLRTVFDLRWVDKGRSAVATDGSGDGGRERGRGTEPSSVTGRGR